MFFPCFAGRHVLFRKSLSPSQHQVKKKFGWLLRSMLDIFCCSWKVKLTRNEASYGIWKASGDTNNYKVKLLKLQLLTRKLKTTDFVLQKYRSKLSSQDAIINFKTSRIRTFQLPAATNTLNIASISQGPLPAYCVFTMVKSDALAGTANADPFFFQGKTIDYFSWLDI